ncbi:MAG: NAD-dependent epimerase/dehydratase family protein [Pseudonocardiaceae bacterium]
MLVTGAAGFVGYAVAALLVAHGHEVIGLTRSPASALPAGVRRLHGDLSTPGTLPAALADVDGVCHLAGLTKVRDSRTNPVDYWRTNVGGTLAILHRLAADQAAADLAATGAIGAISLRAFNVAGALPGHPDRDTTRLIPQLLAVQQGRAPELVINGDGTAVRDFVHVADMATAFALALCACQAGTWRAYNVGSGHPSTVHDVITTAETVTGRARPPTAHHRRARARDAAGRQHPHPDRAGLATGKINPSRDHRRCVERSNQRVVAHRIVDYGIVLNRLRSVYRGALTCGCLIDHERRARQRTDAPHGWRRAGKAERDRSPPAPDINPASSSRRVAQPTRRDPRQPHNADRIAPVARDDHDASHVPTV